MKRQRGFTIIEVLVAIVVLTVGLLGLVTTAALVTRMIARGQRSAVAMTFAQQRVERLRLSTCAAGTGTGADTLYRGSTLAAINTWTVSKAPAVVNKDSTYLVLLVTNYMTAQNRVRSDTTETEVPCLP